MTIPGNATNTPPVTQLRFASAGHPARARSAGMLWGAVGVLAFSVSLPATRAAIQGGLDAVFVGLERAVVAGLLAALVLTITRQRVPPRALWGRLAVVSAGVVFGFPLFSALAMAIVPAAHGVVIIGLMPAATAAMAVLRGGERPSAGFWLAAAAGLLCVLLFAAVAGAGWPQLADLYVLVAIALGALGYAEGGALARTMGGWQVISWTLVLSLPVLVPVAAVELALHGLPQATGVAWAGFAYVSVVSMFMGFFAWYRGLAQGGIARIGQLQLAQPVLSLLWSAWWLHETVGPGTLVAALAVLACVVLTQRVQQKGAHQKNGAARLLAALADMMEAARSRRYLREMDAHMLSDIGLSHADAREEASRRPWDVVRQKARESAYDPMP